MHLLVRLLLLCLPLTLGAQQPLQYTRLTAENGLSNNSVQCLLQDRRGIVWIGTNGGLNRYDGSSFIQYNLLSQPALSNNVVTSLMQDEDGYIWIGTENGLNVLNPATNSLQRFLHDNTAASPLPQGPIRNIQKMPDGVVWVLSDKWMVTFSDRSRSSVVIIDSTLVQENMVFTSVLTPGAGEIWISYLDQVTVLAERKRINGQEHIGKVICKTTDYAKIYTDSSRVTWSIAYTGIRKFDSSTHRFERWLENDHAPLSPNLHLHTSYCTDGDGNNWQGTDRASLVKYDLQGKKVIDYSWLLKATNATLAYCVYRDNSNNIWVGTDNGVIKISNRTSLFGNILFVRGSVAMKNIRSRRIIADNRQTLYAATENYGLLKMLRTPGGRDSTVELSSFGARPISSLVLRDNSFQLLLNGRYDIGYIYDMWYGGDDVIWLAGYGIGKYNTRTDSLEVFLAGSNEQERFESVNQFAITFDGEQFWTAGEHNLFTFDPRTRHMEAFRDRGGGMPFHNLPCWSLVRAGDWIWAGTGKGLYKVNIHTKECLKVSVHPVLDFGINDICTDRDGSFWISTAGGGIIHYDERTGKVRQYTNNEGLSNNTVCGILQDGKGDLWISTYAGLSYFDRSIDRFTNFYSKDGLNTDEFNRKAFTRLRDGRMIFGGLNGYNIFNPEDAFRRDKPVSIVLTKFSKTTAGGEEENDVFGMGALRRVVIDPGDKFFAFHFTLTDMYDPASNRYMYMLQGLDNAWHGIGNQNFVSFNGLPPGQYVLRIKGNPGKGFSSDNEIVIDIKVKQVFYRTIWFILLVVAAAIGIAYVIVWYRIRQVKKIQYLRTRIASDLHDEVGSSLVHITILADMIKRAESGKSVQGQLSSIAGISREAMSTIKDIIWSIDARYDSMTGMIGHMRDHIHSLLGPAEIAFHFTQHRLQDSEKLTAEFRQNVYLIFKEAINNVVKHSKASCVQIGLEKENGFFSMTISDDGRGLSGNGHSSGQGLNNMRMRAERLRASIDIVSEKGVTVILKVPV